MRRLNYVVKAQAEEAAHVEKRRGEWAEMRAEIDSILEYVSDPMWRAAMIRAYHAGFKRGAEVRAGK